MKYRTHQNGARSNGELRHEGGGVGRRRPGKRGGEGRVLRGVPHRRGCGAGVRWSPSVSSGYVSRSHVESQLRCERDALKSGPSARQGQVYTAGRRSTARREAQRPEAHTDNESHTKQGRRKTEPKADSGHETHNGAKRQSRCKTKDSGVRHIAPRTSGSASETLTGCEYNADARAAPPIQPLAPKPVKSRMAAGFKSPPGASLVDAGPE